MNKNIDGESNEFPRMLVKIVRGGGYKAQSGVTIGKNAVVGACALINKDIPEGATAVGVPCLIITNNPNTQNN